jgi:uncharacterized protein YecT (DUF1311 family)
MSNSVPAFVLASLALFVAWGSSAQDEEIDCANAMVQQEMNICAARDFEAADEELNAVWKEARAAATATDAEQSDDLKGADKALLAAQRGWLAYREAQCTLAGFEARGGSLEPMLVSGCMTDLTRKRIEELKQFINGPAE